jgi:glycosyltransferase involved in cell wall biosynthesis
MRILHLVPDTEGGGAESFVSQLVRVLDAGSVEATLLFCRNGQAKPPILRVPGWGPIFTPPAVRAFVRSRGVDLVHTHLPWTGLQFAVVNRVGVPVVHTAHSEVPNKGRLQQRAERSAVARADGVVAVSSGVAKSIAVAGWKSKRDVRIIPNGSPYPEEAARPGEREGLVWAGRFIENKDPLAFIHLAGQLPGTPCSIVGRGPLETAVRSAAAAARVDVLAWQSAVEEVMRRFRALVVTSRHEGMPMIVLEAMALGLPVVAPDIAGLRELLGDSPFLYPVGDVCALRARAHAVVSDPMVAIEEGQRLRARHLENFSLERAAVRHLELYRSLLCV